MAKGHIEDGKYTITWNLPRLLLPKNRVKLLLNMLVIAQQTIPRGGVLAEVGSTGRSQGPHVHFELIFAGNNCDPAPLFRPGVQHRKGLARLDYTMWRIPDKRPAQIQCAKRQKHPPA